MNRKPCTVNDIFAEFRVQLIHQYGEKEVMQFLYLLFESWMGWQKHQVLLGKQKELTGEETARFERALGELKKNKPIQYILGETWFHSLRLKVTPDVLIPRPETEELVGIVAGDIMQGNINDLSILDICSGSGCIAVSLKSMFSDASVSAIEISPEAISVASENAAGCKTEIRFIRGDILDEAMWKDFPSFQIMVSNPPYVMEHEKSFMAKNVLDYEPHQALFVPDDDPLRYYRAIGDFARIHLESPGTLYLEINEQLAAETESMLRAKGFHKVSVLQDMHQKARFVKAEH